MNIKQTFFGVRQKDLRAKIKDNKRIKTQTKILQFPPQNNFFSWFSEPSARKQTLIKINLQEVAFVVQHLLALTHKVGAGASGCIRSDRHELT